MSTIFVSKLKFFPSTTSEKFFSPASKLQKYQRNFQHGDTYCTCSLEKPFQFLLSLPPSLKFSNETFSSFSFTFSREHIYIYTYIQIILSTTIIVYGFMYVQQCIYTHYHTIALRKSWMNENVECGRLSSHFHWKGPTLEHMMIKKILCLFFPFW